MRNFVLGLVAAIFFLTLSGKAHTLPHPKRMTLAQRQHLQQRTLTHDRGMARFCRLHARLARTLSGVQSCGWHRRQQKWTERELGETFSALSSLLIPHRAAWLCIHRYEGSWTDPNPPFWGGLQMDLTFQRTYGPDLLRRKGTADHWTPDEQMMVAEVAFRSGRGFYPWPNTARYCGLI